MVRMNNGMDTLFSEMDNEARYQAAPLAVRMRPRAINEIVGQEEAIGPNTWLRRAIANDALWTGYNVWFGPGMNLHRTPYNLRNVGYYSEDSVLTGRCSACVHTALNEKGILTNTKHFAFNDQETNRDGLAVFLNEQAARENELRGFQIAIRDGGLKGLMTAFNRLGCTHVAAHQGLMNGILEGEWGYRGFTMTDSVKSSQYFLPRETILAANHQMLGGSNNGAVWGLTVDEVSKDPALQNALR